MPERKRQRSSRRPKAELHVVLLAGGSGTRFWPLSRVARPKQLIALVGRDSLLEGSWKRVRRLAPPRRIWVVTPRKLVADVRSLLPGLRADRLIVEPSPRDTAPAVALACRTVAEAAPGAVVAVFPTDHVIQDSEGFARSVEVAAAAAGRGSLVCLGVKPDRPATGFGYLKCKGKPRRNSAVEVQRFVEKPDAARARRYLRSGDYLWNAGMFVWRAERFLEELQRTAPAIAGAVDAFVGGNSRAWRRATRQSVDYAVMEKAKGVKVVPLIAGWDDVGSWDAAGRLRRQAARDGADEMIIDSPETVVFGDRRFVAVVDAPGLAIVDTPDALLVLARPSSEKVRKVVDELKRRGRGKLL